MAVLANNFLFNKTYGPNPDKARLSSSVQIRISLPASDHIVHPDYEILVRIGKRFLNLDLNEDGMIQFIKAERLNPGGKNAKIGLAISLNRLCIKEGKYCAFSERHSHFVLDNRLINKKDFCWWSVT